VKESAGNAAASRHHDAATPVLIICGCTQQIQTHSVYSATKRTRGDARIHYSSPSRRDISHHFSSYVVRPPTGWRSACAAVCLSPVLHAYRPPPPARSRPDGGVCCGKKNLSGAKSAHTAAAIQRAEGSRAGRGNIAMHTMALFW